MGYKKRGGYCDSLPKQKKSKGLTIYKGVVFLTFDNFTIIAEKLTQIDKRKAFIAEGNVKLENGVEQKEVEKITLRFGRDGLKIDF